MCVCVGGVPLILFVGLCCVTDDCTVALEEGPGNYVPPRMPKEWTQPPSPASSSRGPLGCDGGRYSPGGPLLALSIPVRAASGAPVQQVLSAAWCWAPLGVQGPRPDEEAQTRVRALRWCPARC